MCAFKLFPLLARHMAGAWFCPGDTSRKITIRQVADLMLRQVPYDFEPLVVKSQGGLYSGVARSDRVPAGKIVKGGPEEGKQSSLRTQTADL